MTKYSKILTPSSQLIGPCGLCGEPTYLKFCEECFNLIDDLRKVNGKSIKEIVDIIKNISDQR